MNIYISGISGTAMGPLALFARQAGHQVFGTDLQSGPVSSELLAANIQFTTGPDTQSGDFLRQIHHRHPIDWLVHTSAINHEHPELQLASSLGIKISKRDEFISFLIDQLDLKLIAIAGTHGKTTTTSMIIWACHQLGLPVSYLVGSTLPFAPSGAYQSETKYLIYEADEYDRNFLHYRPWLSAICSVSYDHPDIYPTETDYHAAFAQFRSQSQSIIEADRPDPRLTLAGEIRRLDATIAFAVVQKLAEDHNFSLDQNNLITTLNAFPGAGRRFEQIIPGVYSDYAHHPEEISATIALALEQAKLEGRASLTVVYQPHQNSRQHQVKNGYKKAFLGADQIYWLPTFLTREDPNLPILSPAELSSLLENHNRCQTANLDQHLANRLLEAWKGNSLVLLLTAGPADSWFRQVFSPHSPSS